MVSHFLGRKREMHTRGLAQGAVRIVLRSDRGRVDQCCDSEDQRETRTVIESTRLSTRRVAHQKIGQSFRCTDLEMILKSVKQ